MKGIFRVLSLLLSAVFLAGILAVTPVSAKSEKSGKFKYKVLSDGSARLIEYTGKRSTLRLPEKLGGHKLTELGKYAFSHLKIKSVSIPDGVKKIGKDCFAYCKNLKNVTLHKGLEEIGERAFDSCAIEKIKLPSSLKSIGDGAFEDNVITSVKIPKNVKYIGQEAFFSFFGKRKLEKISVAKGNKWYSSKANVLYNKKKTKLLLYPPRRAEKSFITPKSVKEICQGAFCRAKLETLTITGNVKIFRKEAFSYAEISKGLTIKNGLRSIKSNAFYYARFEKKGELKLPDSVRHIGSDAFFGTNLSSVNIPKSLRKIGWCAFFGSDLTELTIPASVKKIEYAAFGFIVGECGIVDKPMKSFIVRGKRNSAAHKYAKKYKMKFIAI